MVKKLALLIGMCASLMLLWVFLVNSVLGKSDAEPRTAFIVCHKDGSAVVPGRLHVNPGDYIEFTAINADATVFMPDTSVVSEHLFEIRKSESYTLQVLTTAEPGEYPYAVFCGGEVRNFAEGQSSPVIMIEPPEPNGG